MKRWLAILPVVALVALVAVGVTRLTDKSPASSTFASPTRPAPDFDTVTLDGEAINFARLKGPVLVNFWATWCTPCLAEHPLLVELAEEGVPIVGVLHKDKTELARAFLKKSGNPFAQVALDPIGDAALAVGLTGVPETFLIDAKGVIVKTSRGPIDGQRARDFLEAYRAELAAAGE